MQALILAAGMGSRLAPLTDNSTKCMVPLHGRPLLAYMLDGLRELGLSRAVVVVGHGAAAVRALLGDCYLGLPISYVENPDYRTTNNVYSVYLAGAQLAAEDTLLIESDLIVDPAILHACAAAAGPAVAVLAPFEPWMDGTVTLLDEELFVRRFVPKGAIEPALIDSYFKTVNIYKLTRDFCRDHFLPGLQSHVDRASTGIYYEQVLGEIVERGLARVRGVVVRSAPWYEIDTTADLRAAEELFAAFATRARLGYAPADAAPLP